MRILYIDTSSSYLYAGIVEDNKLLGEVKKDYGSDLSKEALPRIADIFKTCNLQPKDIDKIIVVNGPGSFTGIRIGVTIAKVYAWSLKLPITIISALEAMSLSSEKEVVHVPVINARRGYVYGAIYDKDNSIIMEPKHILIDDLKKELEKLTSYEIITNDEFAEFNETSKYDPNILKIVTTFKDKVAINPHAVNPEYLKLTEAEESKNDRRSE